MNNNSPTRNVFVLKLVWTACGFVLQASGLAMMFLNYHSQNKITVDVKQIVSGSFDGTSIGIVVILLGTMLQMTAIRTIYQIDTKKKNTAIPSPTNDILSVPDRTGSDRNDRPTRSSLRRSSAQYKR